MSEMAKRLAALREEIERETGLEAEMAAGLLLSDICVALRLPEAERRAVLGPCGLALVGEVEGLAVALARGR